MSNDAEHESFVEFKNSFAAGSRSDLSFKFVKNLSAEDAGLFFQELLHRLADTFDDRDLDRLLAHVLEWQSRAYAGAGKWVYETGPFTPLSKPLPKARIALLTSSGHFVDGDDPEPFGIKDMTQSEAADRIGEFIKSEPQLSTIPVHTSPDKLRVRHAGYDVRSPQADPNVAFPLEHMRDFVDEGRIGGLAENAYSFVGACAQTPLLKRTGPKWVELLRTQSVDGAVLVPV